MGWAKRSIDKEKHKQEVEKRKKEEEDHMHEMMKQQQMMFQQMVSTMPMGSMSSWMGSDWDGYGYDDWDGYGYDEGCGGPGSGSMGSACGGCGGTPPGAGQSAPSRPPGVRPQVVPPRVGSPPEATPSQPSGLLARTKVGTETYHGTVLEFKGSFGWIEPFPAIEHPLAQKHGGKIYVSISDVKCGSITAGQLVRFRLYHDASGLGAEDCQVV